MRIAVIDYGLGNLHSLVKALEGNGRVVSVEPDPLATLGHDVIVLPGVGAFAPAAAALAPTREQIATAVRQGRPCLGVCLGMQLLCDDSEEGSGTGLGLFAGHVTRLNARRVPQIGWNTLEDVRDPVLAAGGMKTAYFANGFACRVADADVVAWSTHETDRFPAAIRRGRVVGVQFHPEKSSRTGVEFVRALLADIVQ